MKYGAQPQAYEERLLVALLRARLNMADFVMAQRPEVSFRVYQEVLGYQPSMGEDSRFLLQWGRVNHRLGKMEEARKALEALLGLDRDLPPATRMVARRYLQEMNRARALLGGTDR